MSKDLRASEIQRFINRDNPIILEIGCNDGIDTLEFLKAIPNARVYCFEPDPRAIKRFHKTVDDKRVSLDEVAISNVDGQAVFYGSSGRPPERSRHPGALACCFLDEWDLSGSLCRPTGHLDFSPWTTFPKDRQYQVETLRLDTWLNEHPEIYRIDFIWCDVQGAEALVIKGGSRLLALTEYFYTEFYDKPLYEGQLSLEKLQERLPSFEVEGIYGDNVIFKNKGELT